MFKHRERGHSLRSKGLTVAVAGALASTTLAACSAGHTAVPTATSQGVNTLVVGTTGAPASLDFTTSSGAAIPTALMGSVYETLVRIDETGAITPWLAESWEISPDQTTYTFHLRNDVTFSTGEPFTAETAAWSIRNVTSDAWTNGLKAGMKLVTDAQALDPHTLQVTLSQASTSWLWSMGTLIGAMLHPDHVANLKTEAIGTGPYMVDGYAVGQAVSYTANPTYWGTPAHHNKAIVRYFADATAATNALLSADIDVLWAAQQPELLNTLTDFAIYQGTTNGEVLLSMNNKAAPFDDVRVRQAVMYAVDRQAVIDTAWSGYGTDTGGQPVPPTDPWFEEHNPYPYDPEKARQLLAETGLNGTELTVTITVPSLPYAQAISEILVSQLQHVGFNARIEAAEFPAVWLNQVMTTKNYQMSLIAHVEARDIPTLFGNPDYYLGYDSPATREALSRADSGTAEDQVAAMRDAVGQIMADAAADTLFNFPNIVIARPEVTGIDPNVVTERLPLAAMDTHEEALQ
ncbi:MAG: ABC transporter substrate-binding protein [Corynebacterium sp.]|nr:ABC transporter substrate-binding protein [Corynebacterium sp.]